jgi:hypothetical protein
VVTEEVATSVADWEVVSEVVASAVADWVVTEEAVTAVVVMEEVDILEVMDIPVEMMGTMASVSYSLIFV